MERSSRYQLEHVMAFHFPETSKFSRRRFLQYGTALAATSLLPAQMRSAVPRVNGYPFTLGVASGEPSPDGAVIWTRLALSPLAVDGGMSPELVPVRWEVTEYGKGHKVVSTGTSTARPQWGHSVHVELSGLKPEHWYSYRFMVGDAVSPVGRFRTWPAANASPDRLRFAFASCQKYEIGHYTAFEHMAAEDLDLIVHLGDYIYEKKDGKAAVRPHGLSTAITLSDYRQRYSLYKTDPALQAAHAMAPWLVTWDDHEFSNDYANLISEDPEDWTLDAFRARREAAYRAYYENMPLRPSARPSCEHLRLHRRSDFGRLARFHILDTRQYRSDQPGNGDEMPSDFPGLYDPKTTMLGEEQRDWLLDGLERSNATWNVLAQQVLMARVDLKPGAGEMIDVDKWGGYEHERRTVLQHLHDAKVMNPVVITGDIHRNWANELTANFNSANADPVAAEFVGTSITSSGDGEKRPDFVDTLMAENPSVKYFNGERGYVRCEITPKTWQTDFRTLPYVSRPGAPIRTAASFVLENGRSNLLPA
ncbi:alkaline phosphatase D family protein [Puniceicoccaceae bacterium K14]|nr:alkaline phosphatase D family protein [Puniceicoccaceae bacterium K14]